MKKILILLLSLLLFVGCAQKDDDDENVGINPPPTSMPTVTIRSQGASNVTVSVELARTDAEQEFGLKFRSSLDPLAGMLFIFNSEDLRSFTMVDTFIALDIIFIDSNFRIVDIEKNTVPETFGPYTSGIAFSYALEVNAGFSDNFSINPGDTVSFSGFDF